jgi:hypothetical protein
MYKKVITITALIVPIIAAGQANYFNSGDVSSSGSTGNYNVPSHWGTGLVPSTADAATVIAGGRTAVLDNAVPDIKAFLVGSGFVATNGASVSVIELYPGRGAGGGGSFVHFDLRWSSYSLSCSDAWCTDGV